MDFRELFLAQHARSHAAGVVHPDFSNQDLILRDLPGELLRVRPHPGLNSLAWQAEGLHPYAHRVSAHLFSHWAVRGYSRSAWLSNLVSQADRLFLSTSPQVATAQWAVGQRRR